MIALALLMAAPLVGCEAAERLSVIDGKNCHGEMAQKSDDEMAAQWRRTLTEFRRRDAENRREKLNVPVMAVNLLASQRAWLRYRDAQCGVISDQAAGGTGYGDMDSFCRLQLTRQRTADLRQLATGFLMPKVG